MRGWTGLAGGWPLHVFLESLLESSMSREIRLSRKFCGKLQVILTLRDWKDGTFHLSGRYRTYTEAGKPQFTHEATLVHMFWIPFAVFPVSTT